nr:general stress protein [Galbitalea soli]
MPKGEALGTYESYLEAQAAVEKLSRADFDVTKVSIVGNDLKTVERVTGKITYGRAAAAGAASGAWFGLFAGLLFFIFTTTPNVGYVLAAILIGAGSGMLFGVGTFAINRRRRDFTSTHQVIASNYQVVVPADQIVRAQEALSRAAELD